MNLRESHKVQCPEMYLERRKRKKFLTQNEGRLLLRMSELRQWHIELRTDKSQHTSGW